MTQVSEPLPTKRPKGFQKGQVLNPNGRPKGAVSQSTKTLLALREKALLDADKVYDVLLRSVLSGDLKAIEMWFKQFGSLPARYKYEMMNLKELQNPDATATDKLKIIQEALLNCNDYTLNELLDIFKAVSNHKLGETLLETDAATRLTLDESKEQLRLIEEAIEKQQQLTKG